LYLALAGRLNQLFGLYGCDLQSDSPDNNRFVLVGGRRLVHRENLDVLQHGRDRYGSPGPPFGREHIDPVSRQQKSGDADDFINPYRHRTHARFDNRG